MLKPKFMAFKEFIETLEDAAQYDNVIVFLSLKRWAVANCGPIEHNWPLCVRDTLKTLHDGFSPKDLHRLVAVPKTSSRGLDDDAFKDKKND